MVQKREQLAPPECLGSGWQSSWEMDGGTRAQDRKEPAGSEQLGSQRAWGRDPMGLRASVFLFRRARELVKDQATESLGSLVYKSGRTGSLHNKHSPKDQPLNNRVYPSLVLCVVTGQQRDRSLQSLKDPG